MFATNASVDNQQVALCQTDPGPDNPRDSGTNGRTVSGLDTNGEDAETVHKHPIQFDQLPSELRIGILQQLPSVFDRLVCAELNRDWKKLVQSKAAWDDYSGLIVNLHNHPFDPIPSTNQRDRSSTIRFVLYDPVKPMEGVSILSWGQFLRLKRLLPPITHLQFITTRQVTNKFERGSWLTYPLDQLAALLSDVRLIEMNTKTGMRPSNPQAPELYGLCSLLMLRGHKTLRSLETDWNQTDLLEEAQLYTPVLDTLSVKLFYHHKKKYSSQPESLQPPVSICELDCDLTTVAGLELIRCKWNQLKSLTVKVRLDVTDVDDLPFPEFFVSDLLNMLGTSNPDASVHLKLWLNIDEFDDSYSDKRFDHEVLTALFNHDATSLTCPIHNLKMLTLSLDIFIEVQSQYQGDYWWECVSSMLVRTTWLQGLIQKWCPALECLVLRPMCGMANDTAADFVQYVLELVLERQSGLDFQLMLPVRVPPKYYFGPGYDELKEQLLSMFNGKGYTCEYDLVSPAAGPQFGHERRVCEWKLCVTPAPPKSGPVLTVFGAQ